MQACTKTHHFEIKNTKIFWGGDTLPRSHRPRRLDLRAYGAQAQRDTPKKILVTALPRRPENTPPPWEFLYALSVVHYGPRRPSRYRSLQWGSQGDIKEVVIKEVGTVVLPSDDKW